MVQAIWYRSFPLGKSAQPVLHPLKNVVVLEINIYKHIVELTGYSSCCIDKYTMVCIGACTTHKKM